MPRTLPGREARGDTCWIQGSALPGVHHKKSTLPMNTSCARGMEVAQPARDQGGQPNRDRRSREAGDGSARMKFIRGSPALSEDRQQIPAWPLYLTHRRNAVQHSIGSIKRDDPTGAKHSSHRAPYVPESWKIQPYTRFVAEPPDCRDQSPARSLDKYHSGNRWLKSARDQRYDATFTPSDVRSELGRSRQGQTYFEH